MQLLGVSLKVNLLVVVALVHIFGIGFKLSRLICDELGFGVDLRVFNLSIFQWVKLSKFLEGGFFCFKNFSHQLFFESDLRKIISDNIFLLVNQSTYKGVRHFYGLPVRGQRTHTNSSKKNKGF